MQFSLDLSHLKVQFGSLGFRNLLENKNFLNSDFDVLLLQKSVSTNLTHTTRNPVVWAFGKKCGTSTTRLALVHRFGMTVVRRRRRMYSAINKHVDGNAKSPVCIFHFPHFDCCSYTPFFDYLKVVKFSIFVESEMEKIEFAF